MKARRRRRFRVAKVRFSVVQHVHVSKEKKKFAKGGEQNLSSEIFRITKVIEATTTRLRAAGFKQDADSGTILRGGIHLSDKDHIHDR